MLFKLHNFSIFVMLLLILFSCKRAGVKLESLHVSMFYENLDSLGSQSLSFTSLHLLATEKGLYW